MSLFDKAINAASDLARSSADNYKRSQQRRVVFDQIAMHQQTIAWSLARIGRLRLEANKANGSPLPASAGPAVEAIKTWEADIARLTDQLHVLDAQAAAMHAQQPGQQLPGNRPPLR
ncbi:MAG: hypothetical protein ACR2KJ_08000 [Jatrophihabitans sp.]